MPVEVTIDRPVPPPATVTIVVGEDTAKVLVNLLNYTPVLDSAPDLRKVYDALYNAGIVPTYTNGPKGYNEIVRQVKLRVARGY